jgi:uncharacterized protein (TIGR00730 family)
MKKIAVFCGSSTGNKVVYTEAALALADTLIKNQLSLVYGGANRGLMGILANRMLEKNGQVIGIMPGFLIDMEVAHHGITKLVKVETMHQRKALMQQEADGFIAMPGGFGTLEEIFEMITWSQLKLHQKPCAFLNINGYFNFVESLLENAVNEGFLKEEYKEMIIIADNPQTLIRKMTTYQHPTTDKLS